MQISMIDTQKKTFRAKQWKRNCKKYLRKIFCFVRRLNYFSVNAKRISFILFIAGLVCLFFIAWFSLALYLSLEHLLSKATNTRIREHAIMRIKKVLVASLCHVARCIYNSMSSRHHMNLTVFHSYSIKRFSWVEVVVHWLCGWRILCFTRRPKKWKVGVISVNRFDRLSVTWWNSFFISCRKKETSNRCCRTLSRERALAATHAIQNNRKNNEAMRNKRKIT